MIQGKWLYNVVLISAIQQHKSVISIYVYIYTYVYKYVYA